MTHPFLHRIQSAALGALVLGALSVPMVLAQPGEGAAPQPAKAGNHQQWDAKRKEAHKQFMDELNLTPEQKQKMKAAHESFRKENAGTMEQLKSKRAEMKKLGDDPANAKRKEQLKAEMKQDWQTLKVKKKAAMQGILTPEQEAKMEARKQAHRQSHGKHHGGEGKPATPN